MRRSPLCFEAIASFIFWIGVIIMPIVIIYGGILFAISGGDPIKVRTARKTLLYSTIGLIILLMSKMIAFLIKDILGA